MDLGLGNLDRHDRIRVGFRLTYTHDPIERQNTSQESELTKDKVI